MKIVLATRNTGKIKELKQMLQVDGIEFIPVSKFNIEDPEETGSTYAENAVLKVRFAAKHTGLPAIADDSGMELPALDDYPGIYSARCAGEGATDEEKRQHILEKMKGIEDRRVKFVCCVALAWPPGTKLTSYFTGECYGVLLEEARGKADPNIQYDSLFYYPDMEMTLAEMPKEDKNKISHRFHACRSMKSYLEILKGRR